MRLRKRSHGAPIQEGGIAPGDHLKIGRTSYVVLLRAAFIVGSAGTGLSHFRNDHRTARSPRVPVIRTGVDVSCSFPDVCALQRIHSQHAHGARGPHCGTVVIPPLDAAAVDEPAVPPRFQTVLVSSFDSTA